MFQRKDFHKSRKALFSAGSGSSSVRNAGPTSLHMRRERSRPTRVSPATDSALMAYVLAGDTLAQRSSARLRGGAREWRRDDITLVAVRRTS